MTNLIGQPEVTRRLGVKPITIHRWRKRPDLDFPASIKIGDRVFFRADEIDAWIDARAGKGAKS